jgi:hypothetical protein
MDLPKSTGRVMKRFEADARQLVPVQDEIGGTVIYLNGRLAYYVLNGEWFQAVQSRVGAPGSRGEWVGEPPTHDLSASELMSTS